VRERLGKQAHLLELDEHHGARGSMLMESFEAAKRSFKAANCSTDQYILDHDIPGIDIILTRYADLQILYFPDNLLKAS
jgi:hypothetical protein